MTLIASCSLNAEKFLLGDLLLSGDESVGSEVGVPSIGKATQVFPEGSGFTISGLRQKVNLISPYCALAWAGSRIVAKDISIELKKLSELDRLTFSSLGDCLRSYEKENIKVLSYLIEGDRVREMSLGTDITAVTSQVVGDLRIAGQTDHFLRGIAEYDRFYNCVFPGSFQVGVEKLLCMIGYMLSKEADDWSSLLHYYGGSYELAGIGNGMFGKISDFSFVLWNAECSEAEISMTVPQTVIKQTYAEEILLTRVLRVGKGVDGHPAIVENPSTFFTLPVYMDDDYCRGRRYTIPDINSQFTVHVVKCRTSTGFVRAVRTELADGKPKCTFIHDDFRISVNQGFVGDILAELKRSVAAENRS